MDKIPEGYFMPFLFGEVAQETPDWLNGLQITSYDIDKNPIAVPLSVALLLHPDVGFVSIKNASPDGPPANGAVSLRAALVHEATARRERLKEIYGARENPEDRPDVLDLVPEPAEEDSLLSVPMEIFMISFDDL